MKMNLNEAKQILNKSGYLLENESLISKQKIIKFAYLYCLLKDRGIDVNSNENNVFAGEVNFYLDDLDIYISSDPYGWTAGVERDSDIIYFSVLVDENEGSSRGTKFSLDELLTLVKKRNFAEIKKIALEIQNDKTLKLNSEL
jgi:hypothetical protein